MFTINNINPLLGNDAIWHHTLWTSIFIQPLFENTNVLLFPVPVYMKYLMDHMVLPVLPTHRGISLR